MKTKKKNEIILLFLYVCMFTHAYVHAHVSVYYMWRSENNLMEVDSVCLYIVPANQIQVIKLGDNCTYLSLCLFCFETGSYVAQANLSPLYITKAGFLPHKCWVYWPGSGFI